MTKVIDLTGKVFFSWTVIERTNNSQSGKAKWICKCKCGAIKEIFSCNLTSGKSTRCHKCSNIKHGMTRTHTYVCYYSMVQRCTNPKNKHYSRYGGRGIHICEKWLESFENFLNDVGIIADDKELDRINNDLGYSKENCRLATRKENMNNRSNSLRTGMKSNNWEIMKKDDKPRYYIIQCVKCNYSKQIRSGYFKTLKEHKCKVKNV